MLPASLAEASQWSRTPAARTLRPAGKGMGAAMVNGGGPP